MKLFRRKTDTSKFIRSNNKEAAHTNFWETSDAIFGSALLVGSALSFIFPLSAENVVPTNIRVALGGFVVLIGILVVALAKVQFSRAKQPSAPGKPTTHLLQDGIFKYTRNPLYLGLVFVLVGLGLTFDMLWWVVLTGPVVGLVQWILIIPEEKYLAKKFGDEYLTYASRVRRWI